VLSRSTVFATVHKGASSFIADDLARFLVRSNRFTERRAVGSQLRRGVQVQDYVSWPEEGLLGVRIYPAEFQSLLDDSAGFKGFAEKSALVFVQRDPRDAAVSLFYSKAYSHTKRVPDKAKFLEDRKRLQALSPIDGVREMTARPAIAEFSRLHKLHDDHGGLMTRYEDMVTTPDAWFRRVGEFVGWPDEFISALSKKFADSFKPPSTERANKHKRRITPGNWEEIFDDEMCGFFDDEVGDLLLANGYR